MLSCFPPRIFYVALLTDDVSHFLSCRKLINEKNHFDFANFVENLGQIIVVINARFLDIYCLKET